MGAFTGFGGLWLPRSLAKPVSVNDITSQEVLLSYLDKVKQGAVVQAVEYVKQAYEQRGQHQSPVTNLLYSIEHAMVHLGYLRMELKSRGIRCPSVKQRLRLTGGRS